MSCGGDEVQKGMDSVIPETWVTLDTRLFRQDVVILAFKMANDLLEAEVAPSLIMRS